MEFEMNMDFDDMSSDMSSDSNEFGDGFDSDFDIGLGLDVDTDTFMGMFLGLALILISPITFTASCVVGCFESKRMRSWIKFLRYAALITTGTFLLVFLVVIIANVLS